MFLAIVMGLAGFRYVTSDGKPSTPAPVSGGGAGGSPGSSPPPPAPHIEQTEEGETVLVPAGSHLVEHDGETYIVPDVIPVGSVLVWLPNGTYAIMPESNVPGPIEQDPANQYNFTDEEIDDAQNQPPIVGSDDSINQGMGGAESFQLYDFGPAGYLPRIPYRAWRKKIRPAGFENRNGKPARLAT